LGGPAYIVRNLVFGQRGNPIKNRYAAEGGIFINNTFIGNDGDGVDMVFGAHTRNNIFLVTPGKTRSLRVDVSSPSRIKVLDMDYDAVGAMGPNGKALADFTAETGLEKHGFQFGSNEEILNANPSIPEQFKIKDHWRIPASFMQATDRPHPDLSLKPGCRAIGAGVVVPNLSEGTSGKVDLGALPFGQPLPHYGPRP
ncbi:MAG: hypothetical protein FWD53_04190, partial [Phycisphaerales bacterium]|nr:hypothetical protein [Phycisphaerales bacterium]